MENPIIFFEPLGRSLHCLDARVEGSPREEQDLPIIALNAQLEVAG
jgi:hypothetical protein